MSVNHGAEHLLVCATCGAYVPSLSDPCERPGPRLPHPVMEELHRVAEDAGLPLEEAVAVLWLAGLAAVGRGGDGAALELRRLRRRLDGERDEDEAPPPDGGTIVPFRP